MKKIKLISKILLFLVIISCSSDDSSADGNEPMNNNNLVKREYASNNINLEYRYNENNQLDQIIDIYTSENIDSETDFVYDSNNVSSRSFVSNNSSFSSNTTFTYDSSNRLLNATKTINQPSNTVNPTITRTEEYSYNNNLITINTSSSTGDTGIIMLERNNGLITKITRDQNYATIEYDNNQNITVINVFDSSNNLSHTSEYEYDNNPNPFFGQLSSIYLHLFVDAFDDFEFGEFVWDGYEGYFFPFLRNNIISIQENGNLDRNYQYSYNGQNNPTNVVEIFNGTNSFEFDIEY
ncbi:hypothetical protein [Mesoflavibacter sp. CH_XMU1422-2]|uniref:hypothetical protein n=1 Tax=Mesoflavibacter sp. CH_XMU1422-2 TaxID=3107770 RepID=UPI00300B81FF